MAKLELINLSKSYKTVRALSHMSVTLTEGIYGLLGPNGAGKSTLIKIITDNLNADEGSVLFNGVPIHKLGMKYREKLGYMPQELGLYRDFSLEQFLHYIAVLKDISYKDAKHRIAHLLASLELSDAKQKKIGALSGGMLRRAGLAQALMNDPDILILDEPTAGLDPIQRIHIRNYISEISRQKIILIATHVVPDVEFIAKEILIMQKGELIDRGTSAELAEKVRTREVFLPDEQDLAMYQQQYKVGNILNDGNGIRLRIVDSDNLSVGVPVSSTLEDYYLSVFGTVGDQM